MKTNEPYVLMHKRCTVCDGEGSVQHHEWEDFYRSFRFFCSADDGHMGWWRDRGYERAEDLPPEEITCTHCHGAGEVMVYVPLREALNRIQGDDGK